MWTKHHVVLPLTSSDLLDRSVDLVNLASGPRSLLFCYFLLLLVKVRMHLILPQ